MFGGGSLTGVAAASANDVWAVGVSDGRKTLALHWDGVQWTVVTTPNSGTSSLSSVTVVSTSARRDPAGLPPRTRTTGEGL